jgi:hypothetical protein
VPRTYFEAIHPNLTQNALKSLTHAMTPNIALLNRTNRSEQSINNLPGRSCHDYYSFLLNIAHLFIHNAATKLLYLYKKVSPKLEGDGETSKF